MATQLPTIEVPSEPEEPKVSLATPDAVGPPTVSLQEPTTTSIWPSPELATNRVDKAYFGSGPILPQDKKEPFQTIITGNEDKLRQSMAATMDFNKGMERQQALMDHVKANGSIDPAVAQRILSGAPTDPTSVIEDNYAKKHVEGLQTAATRIEDTFYTQARAEIPDQVDSIERGASEVLAKREFAISQSQNIGEEIKNQGWAPWLADQAKGLFQPYVEAKLRGNVEGVGVLGGGLMLGNNLKEQADQLLSLPYPEYKKQLTNILTNLRKDNPGIAQQFSDYVAGSTTADRYLNNTFTVISAPDAVAGVKGTAALARKIALYNSTSKAAKDMIRAARATDNLAAATAEGAGDVGEAAVQRQTKSVMNSTEGKGNPTQEASDTLISSMRTDPESWDSNTGSMTREQLTNLKNGWDGRTKEVDAAISTALKVERTPVAVATENAIRAIKDNIRESFKGIKDSIIDITNPRHDNTTNTYWHDVFIGNHGGELFSNPQTARNFAKLYGMADADILDNGASGPYKFYVPESAVRTVSGAANPDFGVKVVNGIPTFYSDIANDIRVTHSTVPDAGMVPVTLGKKHAGLPPVKDGNVRFFHGGEEPTTGGKRWVSAQLEYARDYRGGPNTVHYVDVPKDEAIRMGAWDEINNIPRNAEVDEQYAKKMKEVPSYDSVAFHDPLTAATASIEQQGLGYYLKVTKPLNETDDSVRSFALANRNAISSVGVKGQSGWKNALLGKLRSPDDTLAYNETVNRKVATYAQAGLQKAAHDIGGYIEQIYTGVLKSDPVTGEAIPWWKAKPRSLWTKLEQKKVIEQFEKTMDFARSAQDPATGKKGYYFRTPGELEDHYMRFFNRTPSYAETEAYFAAVQYNEYDRVLRNISEYRNRARVGTEQHSIKRLDKQGQEIASPYFDGMTKKVFPGGEGNVLVTGVNMGEEKMFSLGNISQKTLEDFRAGVKDGTYKLIEVYTPGENPLQNFSEFGNTAPRYVLTRNSDTKKLGYEHVERRGGGHFEYDYQNYIKQGKVTATSFVNANDKRVVQHVYNGDTTLMPIENGALGRDIAGHLNKVRELIRDKDLLEARRYAKENLPMEWKEVRGWFFPKRDPDGNMIPAHLDLNEPFQVVPKNGSIYGIDKDLENRYKGTFVDNSKAGSMNTQYQVAYNRPRTDEDIMTVKAVGTKENPLYAYEKADMVDPIPTMNRALQRSINSTFMDDYKIHAVEHWLAEAATYLKEDMSSIKSSPFWNFTNINEKSFKPDAPKDKVWNLMSNRNKIQQFIGMPDKVDTWIHGVTQKMADQFYDSYGPEGSRNLGEKAMTLAPLWALSKVKDPIPWMRSVTFNAKIGLFALPQFFVQSQTFTNIIAVSPRAGISGTYASLLHQWARYSGEEAVLRNLDNYATKLNIGGVKWKSGEWLEARQELVKAGFERVGGEYAMADDIFKHKYIGNTWDNFLKAGQIPFKEGERSTRIGAYYTAFKEFRDVNPTGALTNADRANILQRADLLTVNMSRASSSELHGGILSLPTQFLSYQLRLAELFFGKRLGETTMERTMARARMVGAYSLMYGVPTAFGLTGLPLGDSIRESAMDNGKMLGVQVQPGNYVVGANSARSLIMEGLPAWSMAMISGWGDTKKGNWLNFGDRYGAQGFTQIRDALKSDAPWWRLLGGASVSTFANTIGNTEPMMQKFMSLARGDDPKYQLTLEHFLDLTKEVSSVNTARKWIYAMNTGRWLSSSGAYVGDTSRLNATFMALTGMNPQAQSDLLRVSDITNAEKEGQKTDLKLFINEWRKGLNAEHTNPDMANVYYKNAMARLFASGYPLEKRLSAIALANKGYESQITSTDRKFGTDQNIPMDKRDDRLQRFKTQMNLNQERGQ